MKVLLPVLALSPSLWGCIGVEIQKLPAYDLALQMGGPERPKLFYAESVSQESLPPFTPYATIICWGNKVKEPLARRAWTEAAKLKADVVIVTDAGMVHAGSVNTYWGFGVSTSQPVYNHVIHGVCYRLNPARIGFQTDKSGMVITIDPESNLRAAGMLEGDTLLSINGVAYVADENAHLSAHFLTLLNLTPDEEVALVWIRPGTGRMEAKAKCYANDPRHLTLPDSIEWPKPAPSATHR